MSIKTQNQITLVDATDTFSVILSNENQTFAEVAEGQGTLAETTDSIVYSYRGSTNVYSYLPPDPNTPSPGHNYPSEDGVYVNVTQGHNNPAQDLILTFYIPLGLTSSGTVTFPIHIYETSTITGTPLATFQKTFSYSVARFGEQGQQGDPGVSPTVYSLGCTGTLFSFDNESGTYIGPKINNQVKIVVSAYSQTGSGSITPFSGGSITVTPFKEDGSSDSQHIITGTSSVDITPLPSQGKPEYAYYVASLTVNNNEVDRQTIGLTREGADGKDVLSLVVTSNNGVIFKKNTDNTTLTATLYQGGESISPPTGTQIKWYVNGVYKSTGNSYLVSANNFSSPTVVTTKLETTSQPSEVKVLCDTTISFIADVKEVYTYYLLAASNTPSTAAPKDRVNVPGTNTIVVTDQGVDYTWTLTEPSIDLSQHPDFDLFRIEGTVFTDSSYDWGPMMTSSTYTAAKAAYTLSSQAEQKVGLLGGHFIYKGTTSQSQKTVPSANVVEQVENAHGQDVTDDPRQWGYNVHIGSNGIRLRQNEATLSQWHATSGLTFYGPPVESGGILNDGVALAMYSANGIQLKGYDDNSNQTIGVNLSANGFLVKQDNKTDIFNIDFSVDEPISNPVENSYDTDKVLTSSKTYDITNLHLEGGDTFGITFEGEVIYQCIYDYSVWTSGVSSFPNQRESRLPRGTCTLTGSLINQNCFTYGTSYTRIYVLGTTVSAGEHYPTAIVSADSQLTYSVFYDGENTITVFKTIVTGSTFNDYFNIVESSFRLVSISYNQNIFAPSIIFGTTRYSSTPSGFSSSFGQELWLAPNNPNEFVIGRFNLESDTKNAFTIGNGTGEAYSNALTVDWYGNLEFSGGILNEHLDVLGKIRLEINDDTTNWYPIRDKALIKKSTTPSQGAYSPILSAKTLGGAWGIATGNDNLGIYWGSDTDYENQNNTKYGITLSSSGNLTTSGSITDGSGNSIPAPTTTSPKMNGTATVGSETKYAKGDHIHPTDTSRAPVANPTFTTRATSPAFRVTGHTSDIGTIITANNTSAVSLTAGSPRAVASISMPVGVWVITCYVTLPKPSSLSYALMNFSTSSGNSGRHAEMAQGTASINRLGYTYVYTVSSAATYYFNVQSGVAATVGEGNADIRAVRIA